MSTVEKKPTAVPATSIVPHEPKRFDANALIALAIEREPPVTVEVLERLLAMRRELREEQAREAFNRDFAAFQGACPLIPKERAVNERSGKLRYKYATLDAIMRVIQPYLVQYGFSIGFSGAFGEGIEIVTCHLRHVLGHETMSTFRAPIDKTAYMNEPQKYGGARSYGRRYALCDVLGIVTADQDDDAVKEERIDNGPSAAKLTILVETFKKVYVDQAALERRQGKPLAEFTSMDLVSLDAWYGQLVRDRREHEARMQEEENKANQAREGKPDDGYGGL